MTYPERSSAVSIFSTIVASALYYWLASHYFGARMADPAPDLKFWGAFILLYVPASVIITIIIRILYIVIEMAITRVENSDLVDELGKLVELKAVRNFGYAFLLGFFLTMLALVLGMAANTMFLCFFLSMVAAGIFLDASQLWYYRRGVSLA